jgi:hypothetical protein
MFEQYFETTAKFIQQHRKEKMLELIGCLLKTIFPFEWKDVLYFY